LGGAHVSVGFRPTFVLPLPGKRLVGGDGGAIPLLVVINDHVIDAAAPDRLGTTYQKYVLLGSRPTP
jgi:hypothetical protein